MLPPVNGWLSIAFSDGRITWALPICHKDARWSPDDWHRAKDLVLQFLRSKCVKVAHSLPFELEWMTQIYGHNPRWRRTGWGDTMSQAYVLDERRGGLSLDDCCLHRFGFRLKSQSNVDRSRLAEEGIDRLLKYNALDAKYEAKLYHVQAEEIEQEGLQEAYKLHLRRCLTLVRAQQKGLVVDFDAVAKFQKKMQRKIDQCLLEIADSREARLYEKKIGKPLEPTSNPQLVVLFRDLLDRREGQRKKNKTGYSVDDSALEKMDLPIASAVLRLRSYSKMKSTYIDPCAPVGGVVYADGRLHTKFNDLFTVTGRLSSQDPNVQNFPMREDAWVRAIVTAPKTHPITGASCKHVLLSCDYGQIEPRVIAMESRDKRLVRSFVDRHDIHGDWAERIAKADLRAYREYGNDLKKLRQDVKSNWVLAGFYGAAWESIAARLKLSRKCEDLFEEFKGAFPGVWKWQEKQLADYQHDGYVTGLTGRRRRAPLSTNQLLNNITQGVASDLVVEAMNRLSVRAEKEEEPAFQAVIDLHDDLEFYIPKDRLEGLQEEIVREMLTPAFDWVNVPMSVEVKIGENWADMRPVGTFFSDEL
jgi:DNA polymerase-1